MIYFTYSFLSSKFIVVFFVGSIISSHITPESLIIIPKYSSFSQAHVTGF